MAKVYGTISTNTDKLAAIIISFLQMELHCSSMEQSLLMIVMWLLMILVKVTMLYFVTLTRQTAVIEYMVEQESGTSPMELKCKLRELLKLVTITFLETEVKKSYVSIVLTIH